ncbi:MAG: sugar ABC transporter substrate-binding protein [Lachnospiraceae bacterium]|nr:sugar ABC transporter substrate-binding protein [Lachnospiraceae bacterium]
MSKKRKGAVLRGMLLVTLVSLCLVACAPMDKESIAVTEEENDKIQIGFSMDSFLIERWQRDRDVFVSKAQELGAEVNVQNANGVVEEQISQIEYFIEKEVDVIVIVPIDGDTLTEVVEKAKKSGIKVIAYDRLIHNADVDLYISFDNEKVGSLMATYLKQAIGGGGTLIRILGSPADSNVEMADNGFNSVIEGTNITVDVKEYADGWLAETGYNVTSDYLATGKVPHGIMCGNDGIAAQAIKALSENRLAGSVYVVGQDADLDACQRIVEGTQYMTVYKPIETLAQTAAEIAVSMAEGEVHETDAMIHDGTFEVPYEKLEPIAVTKENMDEVIIGKYHQKSDVYLNVQE